MKYYNHHSVSLENAMEDIQKQDDPDDAWDVVAPCTQSAERGDMDEGDRQASSSLALVPPRNIQADIGVDLGHPVLPEHQEDLLINYIPDDDYYTILRTLNSKQRQFFHHILHWIKTRGEPMHVFLTGGAGVGKTVLVRAIHQSLIRFYNKKPGANPDEAKVLLAAPTRKAAFMMKGNTIHSLLHIFANQGFKYKPLTADKLNTLQAKFREAKVLIIDEISMVGNKLFNYINLRLQQIMGSKHPFGGLSILAIGDFYQLKPVFDAWIFNPLSNDYGPLATNMWQEYFQVFQLTEIMRQKEDKLFAELLNRLRCGIHTDIDIEELKKCSLKQNDPGYDMYQPHIFLSNAKVDDHNTQIFSRVPELLKLSILVHDTVIGDVAADVKEKIIQSVPFESSKTMGLVKNYKCALGLRDEISVNIDVTDGLANGAVCVVMSIPHSHNKRPSYIWVRFTEAQIGKQLRESQRHLYEKDISNDWTPIFEVKRTFSVGRYKSAQVMRTQFPLRPASAKTAHRCQGDTMQSAVVDLSGRPFYHAHYVALSRVTSKDNLFITNLNENKILVDSQVHNEMERLEKEAPVVLCMPLLQRKNSSYSILFHNVQSLHCHFPDIVADDNLLHLDLLIFVETRLASQYSNEQFSLPGYNIQRLIGRIPRHLKDHPMV